MRRIIVAALLLVLSGCSFDGLETAAVSRLGGTPLILPIAKATWAPLRWCVPLLPWGITKC